MRPSTYGPSRLASVIGNKVMHRNLEPPTSKRFHCPFPLHHACRYATSIEFSHHQVIMDLQWLPGIEISTRGKVTKTDARECAFLATTSGDGKVGASSWAPLQLLSCMVPVLCGGKALQKACCQGLPSRQLGPIQAAAMRSSEGWFDGRCCCCSCCCAAQGGRLTAAAAAAAAPAAAQRRGAV